MLTRDLQACPLQRRAWGRPRWHHPQRESRNPQGEFIWEPSLQRVPGAQERAEDGGCVGGEEE